MMHLGVFLSASVTHHSLATWRHPRSSTVNGRYRWDRPEVWLDVARVAEQGLLDMVFFADSNGLNMGFDDTHDGAVRYATQSPRLQPMQLLAMMATATQRVGLAATVSVSAQAPYATARELASLDHLSGGRAGWNVVAGYQRSDAQNLGLENLPPREVRYEAAQEYLEVCDLLWSSWDSDAIVLDVEGSTFADPSKVREINFEGKWFSCRGPLQLHQPPQGRPVILQAGQSSAGRSFGASQADAIFAIGRDWSAMKAFREDMRQRAVEAGRSADDIKILYGVQPIIGETETIAKEKAELHNSLVPTEAGLFYLSGHLGVDLSAMDTDMPFGELEVPGVQGMLEAYRSEEDGAPLSIAEAARRHAQSVGFPQVVGSARQIADWMCEAIDEVGGDGFMISPIYLPGALEDFVELVVPILQAEGVFRREYTGTMLRDHLLQQE